MLQSLSTASKAKMGSDEMPCLTTTQHCLSTEVGAEENHGNMETVIFVKCRKFRDFAKMSCGCCVFCQNAVVLRFSQEYFVFNRHKLNFIV